MLFFCQAVQMEVTEQNSTVFCDMLESEPDLQTHVKKFEGFPLL